LTLCGGRLENTKQSQEASRAFAPTAKDVKQATARLPRRLTRLDSASVKLAFSWGEPAGLPVELWSNRDRREKCAPGGAGKGYCQFYEYML
jgi:hypothetical protein